MNTVQIAELFGVTPRTVTGWIRDGLPVVKAGSRGAGNGAEMDLEAAVRWYFSADRPAEWDRERLSPAEAAALFSTTEKTLREWEHAAFKNHGMFPRNADGSYNLPGLFWWIMAHKKQIGGARG